MARKAMIRSSREQCSGCLRCVLACSFFTSEEKAFSLSKARIQVLPGETDAGPFEITFSSECDGCGICVRYCDFGVLSQD